MTLMHTNVKLLCESKLQLYSANISSKCQNNTLAKEKASGPHDVGTKFCVSGGHMDRTVDKSLLGGEFMNGVWSKCHNLGITTYDHRMTLMPTTVNLLCKSKWQLYSANVSSKCQNNTLA